MSYSFVVAARITISGEAFETWLDTPLPATVVIENPGDMFAGWYWDDRERPEDWSDAGTGITPRELLALRDPEDTITLVRHRDGALEAYLWTPAQSGSWATGQQRLLLMLAGAGGDGDVLFWEETDGSLPSEDSLLALLRVDAHGARFVEDALLGPILTALKPAEDAFYALIADAED
ncbi:hypothetical protein [Catenuloplanes japonicus]|uniref:hypothetical protein n=1 Tax=Catenuloplanes japonicus TaxID=33876 RepID=UPI0005269059|nr:hypothetical protein [Catenuloplanes japonicus]